MTLILNTIAQHPVPAFGLFVVGIIFGYLGMLRAIDARADRQIDEATSAERLRAAANLGSHDEDWRDQVRRDVQNYRAAQEGR